MAYSELPWRPFLGHQALSWTTLRRGNVFCYVYKRGFFIFVNVFMFIWTFVHLCPRHWRIWWRNFWTYSDLCCYLAATLHYPLHSQVWVRGRCKISQPRFLAERCKRQLNQGSFVLLHFRLFIFFRFVLSLFICIFLYCFVCQYQSSDWLWRPPPKWPILCRVGR